MSDISNQASDYIVPRRVVCAAMRNGPYLVVGPRHFDMTMHAQLAILKRADPNLDKKWEQGFIDQFGVFMDRTEAMVVAKASGQPINFTRNGSNPDVLYSEGLY